MRRDLHKKGARPAGYGTYALDSYTDCYARKEYGNNDVEEGARELAPYTALGYARSSSEGKTCRSPLELYEAQQEQVTSKDTGGS